VAALQGTGKGLQSDVRRPSVSPIPTALTYLSGMRPLRLKTFSPASTPSHGGGIFKGHVDPGISQAVLEKRRK